MSKDINLYVVDTSEQLVDKLEEIFYEHPDLNIKVINKAKTFAQCAEDFQNVRQTDVFLISVSLPDKNGIDLIHHLKKKINPNAKFIATVTPNTRNLVDKAIDGGADDYLQKPFEPKKLVDLIYDLVEYNDEAEVESEDDMESYIDEDEDIDVMDFNLSDEDEDNEVEEVKEKKVKQREMLDIFGGATNGRNIFQNKNYDNKPNKVVVFTSPKSMGKTTLISNIASAVTKNSEFEPSVVILDLDLVYPSVAFKYHQDELRFGDKNIYDLMDDINELDMDLIERASITHEPTGIKIIDTPYETIRNFNVVNQEKLRSLILFLREAFDLVLIDTTGNLRDDTTIVSLTLSDVNIVPFVSDLSSLLHTRKFVEMIQLIEKGMGGKIVDNSLFILNRFHDQANLSIDLVKSEIFDIEGAELNVPMYIPEDRLMTKYANRGKMLVDRPGEASEKLTELASKIYPFYADGDEYQPKEASKDSLFKLIKSKFKR